MSNYLKMFSILKTTTRIKLPVEQFTAKIKCYMKYVRHTIKSLIKACDKGFLLSGFQHCPEFFHTRSRLFPDHGDLASRMGYFIWVD